MNHPERDDIIYLASLGLILLMITLNCIATPYPIPNNNSEVETNHKKFYTGVNLAGAEFGLYNESLVRKILLDIALRGGNTTNYDNSMLECKIAVGRWDAGVRVTNSNQFKISAMDSRELNYNNDTPIKNGSEIRLSADDWLLFGPLPGRYGFDYTYPTVEEIDYFIDKGMNVFRLPFRWERLQPDLYGDLNSEELKRMDGIVCYATKKGACVILDPHNFGRYIDGDSRSNIKDIHNDGRVIGRDLPAAAFADFWGKLASHYKDNELAIFGLMNEPHDLSTSAWIDAANAAINAIRKTEARNLILVPGNDWTSVDGWNQSIDGVKNAEAMLEIKDPSNNYAYEVHQYLFNSTNGDTSICIDPSAGSERLMEFTSWLRKHGKRGFLGEFAVGSNGNCYAALDELLMFIRNNSEVWLGWTYWAAGPWWPKDYVFSIEPDNYGNDRPQMIILSRYLSG